MIEKIKKLVTEPTDEQREIEWSEVQSIRIKMLQLSDWTQLEDVVLPENHKREWRLWRQKVRNISRDIIANANTARDALETLQLTIPKFDKIDANLFERKLNEKIDVEIHPVQSNDSFKIEKIILKEQPIILNESISDNAFEEKMNNFVEKNSKRFHEILHNVLTVDKSVIIFHDDTVTVAKEKVLQYLKLKQEELLREKLKKISNIEILSEKFQEAVEFLSENKPNIEDYPLIDLYSDVYKKTYHEVAKDFIEEKRQYNHILFDVERFLLYNQHRLSNTDDLNEVKEILKDIKNGH